MKARSTRRLGVVLAAAALAGSAAAQTVKPVPMDNVGVQFLRLLGERKAQEAFDRYVGPKYIQHNPNFPDGKEAAIKILSSMPPEMSLKHEFKRVLVDGDMIAVHSSMQFRPTDPVMAMVDIFRLENGKIVEHWDLGQAVPAKSQNNNTMF